MKILFIAMPESIHTARWLSQIQDLGWDIYLFPAYAARMHPDIKNVIAFGSTVPGRQTKKSHIRLIWWTIPLFWIDLITSKIRGLPNFFYTAQALTFVIRWLMPIFNPGWVVRGLFSYPRYLNDIRHYRQLNNAEPLRLVDMYPQLHDRSDYHEFDAHYFYVNNWAFRRIVAHRPIHHIDVGSQSLFASLLGAILPVAFVDYRPLQTKVPGLISMGGDILRLPFSTGSITSLSCLHVAEHIGLGRYGDLLNPLGTHQSAQELKRVLAKGGNLIFALPIGKPRVCFNAHRIHASESIIEYFSELELVELSGVHDDSRFVERVGLDEFKESKYACGMFWFRKR